MRQTERGQAHSYYLSNIAPQWQRFNDGIWAALASVRFSPSSSAAQVHAPGVPAAPRLASISFALESGAGRVTC
jgi:hypothetical protein